MLPPLWLWVVCLSFRLWAIRTDTPTKQANYWDDLAPRLWEHRGGGSASPSTSPGLLVSCSLGWNSCCSIFLESKGFVKVSKEQPIYSAHLWTPYTQWTTVNFWRLWAQQSHRGHWFYKLTLKVLLSPSGATKLRHPLKQRFSTSMFQPLWQTSLSKKYLYYNS